MDFVFEECSFDVRNLKKSISFYNQAFNLKESMRINTSDKASVVTFMKSERTPNVLTLTWHNDELKMARPAEADFHATFYTKSYGEALAIHKRMGCVCSEATRTHCVQDPDGHKIRIMAAEGL